MCAALGLGPLDEADRSELGQTHTIRDAAAVDVRNERLNTVARHLLMTEGRALVTAEDVSESRFLLN
jgi:hypothetical protein